MEAEQYKYLSKWHYVAIRELVSLDDFTEDPRWINKKLGTKLNTKRLSKIIEELINLNLLKRTHSGKLKQTDENIVCSPKLFSLAINSFHHQMIQKAAEAITTIKSSDRDMLV